MHSNFDFLKNHAAWAALYQRAVAAEKALAVAPELTAVSCRSAMETGVKWVYQEEGMPTADLLHPGKSKDLFLLLQDKHFTDILASPQLSELLDRLRKVGNRAAHGETITYQDAVLLLRILHEFCRWLIYCYTTEEEPAPFRDSLLPKAGDSVLVSQQRMQDFLEKQKAQAQAFEEKTRQVAVLQAEKEELAAQLQQLRQQKQQAEEFALDPLTEARTRRRFIDWDLQEAGWTLGSNCRTEEFVSEMPNTSGYGFADYVLYGQDMRTLAIVEAKRTSHSAKKGLKQAQLYADSLAKKEGRRPFIFLTNGYDIFFVDDDVKSNYPSRKVAGFFSPSELADRMEQRESRRPLTSGQPDFTIADRPYQIQAVRAVQEAADAKRRKFLVVQATGTGKTRVAVSIVDLMMRTGWVKRVLFLADRTALVRQGKENGFQRFFQDRVSLVNLLEHPEQAATARILFSTYPTMMNAIDTAKEKSGQRIFTPAHFDLIIIDESHRSIYQRYQAIFNYFDALLLGLTATPKSEVDRNTYEFFDLEDGVPTYEYDYNTAVKDGYIVPFRLKNRSTKFLTEGIHYSQLTTKQKEQYEETFGYAGENAPDVESKAMNRWFFNRSTVEKVLKALMNEGLRIKGGDKLGKTIIFAGSRRHAEYIVEVFHKLYPEYGENFIQRIDGSIDYHDVLIQDFSNPEKLPQIAVSVDMLDTGIDVPEILNLVFFKKVRSISKFWQMIGRGTRLCPDVFGPGRDKTKFLIFDYGGSFDYFGVDGQEDTGSKLQKPLSERLYDAQVQVYALLQNKEERSTEETNIYQQLGTNLVSYVQKLDAHSFRVREVRAAYEKYRQKENWQSLSAQDVQEVEKKIAPLMSGLNGEETTRRFDLLLCQMMLEVLQGKEPEKKSEIVREIAVQLGKKKGIPQVKAHLDFIQKAGRTDFWQQITLEKLAQTRKELRQLVQFLAKTAVNPIYGNIDDEEIQKPIPDQPLPGAAGSQLYQAKVTEYLKDHQDNAAIYKLRHNQPLVDADWRELERILWQELGSQKEYQQAFGPLPVGELVRKTVGMDRKALEQAFSEFLQTNQLNARQMNFVQRIIDYLAENGSLKREDIMSDAFADCGDIFSLFSGKETIFDEILTKAEQITGRI